MTVNSFREVKGIRFVSSGKIRLKDIEFEGSNNKARRVSLSPNHQNKVTDSFKRSGQKPYLFKPVIEEITPEMRKAYNIPRSKKYLLLDGHHRYRAMQALGWASGEFDIVSCDSERTRRSFCLNQNVVHDPSLGASVDDCVQHLTWLIKEGPANDGIANTQREVWAEIENTMGALGKIVKEQIAAEALKRNGTKLQFKNYNQQDGLDYLEEFGLTGNQRWNADDECYGAVLAPQSASRVAGHANENFVKFSPNGKQYMPTAVVLKVDYKGKGDINKKRRDLMEELNKVMKNQLAAVGLSEWPNGCPVRVVGAMAQDIGGGEDPNAFYPIDPDTQEFIME